MESELAWLKAAVNGLVILKVILCPWLLMTTVFITGLLRRVDRLEKQLAEEQQESPA